MKKPPQKTPKPTYEELKKEWCVPVKELAEALENTVNFVKTWFSRKSA